MVAGEKTDLHPPHADTPPLPSSTGLSQVPSCHLPSDPSLSASASPWHASCPPPSKFPSRPPLRQGPSVPASGTPMRAPRRSEAWRPHWPLLPCPVTRACGLSKGKSLNRPPARPSGSQIKLEEKKFFSSFPARNRWDRKGKARLDPIDERPLQLVVHTWWSALGATIAIFQRGT